MISLITIAAINLPANTRGAARAMSPIRSGGGSFLLHIYIYLFVYLAPQARSNWKPKSKAQSISRKGTVQTDDLSPVWDAGSSKCREEEGNIQATFTQVSIIPGGTSDIAIGSKTETDEQKLAPVPPISISWNPFFTKN
jgi:hypothetical protein